MKLFDDRKYNIAHQTCDNIKKMCRDRQEKDSYPTKPIAVRSIKEVIEN